MKRSLFLVGLIAVVALAFQNCGPMTKDIPPSGQDLDFMLTKVNELVGKQCVQASDCQQIPVGDEPCGGPSFHLVFSSTGTDVEKLTATINQYNQMQNRYNSENGIAGTCEYLMPYDSLSCDNNVCVGHHQQFSAQGQ